MASPDRYPLLTRLFHWATAVCILALCGLGAWMVEQSYYDPWYHKGLTLHRVLGMVALALGLGFVLRKPFTRSPPLPAGMPRWQHHAAHTVHAAFYFLMLLVPLSGYLVSTSSGAAIPVYDWFEIPALWRVDDAAREWAIRVHYYAAYGTLLLAAMHAGAALKHQFIDRDGVLSRMGWR